jgi:hypothetical protein
MKVFGLYKGVVEPAVYQTAPKLSLKSLPPILLQRSLRSVIIATVDFTH